MPKTTPEQNKFLVLKAFDTLFNMHAMRPQNDSGRRPTFSTAHISHPDAPVCSILSRASRQR